MDKSKAAISNFLSRDGKKDTTVEQNVAPAVVNERVNRTQHEETTRAVDREVHQDHHHTSVQPIQDKSVLPEQHSHQTAAVQEKSFEHGDASQVNAKLEAERAKFQNTRTVGETQHQRSEGPTMTGQHVHHHVHETIQPVIQKETIDPSVTHTTVPIHETHYNEANVKPTTTLPAMSMSDYKSQEPTSVHSSSTRGDDFKGGPKRMDDTLNAHHNLGTIGGQGAGGTTSLTGDLNSHVGPNRGDLPAQKTKYGATDDTAHEGGVDRSTTGMAPSGGSTTAMKSGVQGPESSVLGSSVRDTTTGNKMAHGSSSTNTHGTEGKEEHVSLLQKIKNVVTGE